MLTLTALWATLVAVAFPVRALQQAEQVAGAAGGQAGWRSRWGDAYWPERRGVLWSQAVNGPRGCSTAIPSSGLRTEPLASASIWMPPGVRFRGWLSGSSEIP